MQEQRVPVRHMVRRFLASESEWNPKVAVSRLLAAVLPDKWLFALKRFYYPLLMRYSRGGEEDDAVLVDHLVSPGDCVLDIGASIGGYTKRLSRLVGPGGGGLQL